MLHPRRLLDPLLPIAVVLVAVQIHAAPDPPPAPRAAPSAAPRSSAAPAAPVVGGVPPILPRPMRLEYKGPPGCPEEQHIRTAITAQARVDPFAPDAPVLLKVTLNRKGGMYAGRLEIRDAAGELLRNKEGKVLMDRVLEPESSCIDLVLSLGFIIGEKLRPAGGALPPPSPPPSATVTAAPVATSAPVSGAVALSSAVPASAGTGAAPGSDDAEDQYYFTAHKVRPRFALTALGAFGLLPSPFAYGGQVGLGFQWRRFSFSVEGRALLSTHFALSKDRTASSGLVLAMLTPCVHAGVTRPLYSFDLCAWLGTGRLIFEPDNEPNKPIIQTDQVHPFTIMTGIRPLVSWQFSPHLLPEFLLKPFTEFNLGVYHSRISFNGNAIWDKLPWGVVVGVEIGAVVGQPPKWDKPLAKDPEVARGY